MQTGGSNLDLFLSGPQDDLGQRISLPKMCHNGKRQHQDRGTHWGLQWIELITVVHFGQEDNKTEIWQVARFLCSILNWMAIYTLFKLEDLGSISISFEGARCIIKHTSNNTAHSSMLIASVRSSLQVSSWPCLQERAQKRTKGTWINKYGERWMTTSLFNNILYLKPSWKVDY